MISPGGPQSSADGDRVPEMQSEGDRRVRHFAGAGALSAKSTAAPPFGNALPCSPQNLSSAACESGSHVSLRPPAQPWRPQPDQQESARPAALTWTQASVRPRIRRPPHLESRRGRSTRPGRGVGRRGGGGFRAGTPRPSESRRPAATHNPYAYKHKNTMFIGGRRLFNRRHLLRGD